MKKQKSTLFKKLFEEFDNVFDEEKKDIETSSEDLDSIDDTNELDALGVGDETTDEESGEGDVTITISKADVQALRNLLAAIDAQEVPEGEETTEEEPSEEAPEGEEDDLGLDDELELGDKDEESEGTEEESIEEDEDNPL